MGLGFLSISLEIVLGLLDRRMGKPWIPWTQEAHCFLVRGYVNSSTLHLGQNFLNICIEVAQASWVGLRFLDTNMGYSKSNQNHNLIIITTMVFLDRGLGSLNTCHFQHTTELGQSFILRWKDMIYISENPLSWRRIYTSGLDHALYTWKVQLQLLNMLSCCKA